MRFMKENWVYFLVLAIVGVIWYFGPDIYKHMGGRYEESRREIFEESQAHVHGNIEHLNRLKLEYETAEAGHKPALRTAILTSFGSMNDSQWPPHLRSFIDNLRRTPQ